MKLLARWSLRDLRARWVQVGAIALIIALGSGLYSGLSSTIGWRDRSYDQSFAQLRFHDLRVSLAAENYLSATDLRDTVASIPHARWINAAQPRLVLPTQVDASTGSQAILVPGRIVGSDVSQDRPRVDEIMAKSGRDLRPSDAGRPRALLEYNFADHHNLVVDRSIVVAGDKRLELVGHALQPEYFVPAGDILGEANFAVVFVSLGTAQRLVDRPGMANDVAIALAADADVSVVRDELQEAFKERFSDVGIDLFDRRDSQQFRLLYDDIENDRHFFRIFAILILLAAAFSAFNLTSRIVETQRREIGIGMALGIPPRRLAIRPLFVGLEIALLGVVFGIGLGAVIGWLMAPVLREYVPLPVWQHPFQVGMFLRGAALGIAIPFLATIFPVWRAVRVAPVQAIRSLSTRTRNAVPFLARIPLPGSTTAQMPVRNLLRAPRRTIMTALGIAAAISIIIGIVGLKDSFYETIHRVDREVLREHPRRFDVSLDAILPESSGSVQSITQSPVVAAASTSLRVNATLVAQRDHDVAGSAGEGSTAHNDSDIDVVVELLALDDRGVDLWTPTVHDRHKADGLPGIVITPKAMADLGTAPGAIVTLRHPRRTGPTTYAYVRTRVRIIGTNPLPMRFLAFMDRSDASTMGLAGMVNTVTVAPAAHVSTNDAKRALFDLQGVGSVQPVDAFSSSVRDQLGGILGIFTIVEFAILLLALIIAFNSASINADERARDHATMFAFGLPTRTVTRMSVVESTLVGVLATATGAMAGWLLLAWLVNDIIPQSYPDLQNTAYVSLATLVSAVVFGIVAVALAPLLTVRKLHRMNIASTLRVME